MKLPDPEFVLSLTFSKSQEMMQRYKRVASLKLDRIVLLLFLKVWFLMVSDSFTCFVPCIIFNPLTVEREMEHKYLFKYLNRWWAVRRCHAGAGLPWGPGAGCTSCACTAAPHRSAVWTAPCPAPSGCSSRRWCGRTAPLPPHCSTHRSTRVYLQLWSF